MAEPEIIKFKMLFYPQIIKFKMEFYPPYHEILWLCGQERITEEVIQPQLCCVVINPFENHKTKADALREMLFSPPVHQLMRHLCCYR